MPRGRPLYTGFLSIIHLTLVRHGQASYLEENYDRLSPVGELQSKRLGEFWARRGVCFDAVFSGPAQRHRRTAEIVLRTCRLGGLEWPEAEILPQFDEFPGEQVMRVFAPVLRERHPQIKQMGDAFLAANDAAEKRAAMDRLFHEVSRRWVDAEVSSPEVESWNQFTARVGAGIAEIRRRIRPGDRAVVFTSAGPTAVVVSLALGIPARNTLELAFSPNNGSYSEFRLDAGAVTLSTFNSFPHLDEPELLTYR